MTDRISLTNIRFEGTHGVLEEELLSPQPFEVDVDLFLDLQPAGSADDLSLTADYRAAFEICRETIEGPSCRLIETLAEKIAARLLAEYTAVAVSEVAVRIRKPAVMLPGDLDAAEVEIRRRPTTSSSPGGLRAKP